MHTVAILAIWSVMSGKPLPRRDRLMLRLERALGISFDRYWQHRTRCIAVAAEKMLQSGGM